MSVRISNLSHTQILHLIKLQHYILVHVKRNKFLNIQFAVSGFWFFFVVVVLNKFLLHDLVSRIPL